MMKNIYKTIIYFIFAACVAGGLFLVFSPVFSMLNTPVISPAAGTISGSIREIEIKFPVPMNRETVETRLEISPEQAFDIDWDESTLQIKPRKAVPAGSLLEITLKNGALSSDGRGYTRDFHWSFLIRLPDIVYLGNATASPEVWLYDFTSGNSVALTASGGRVTDLATSRAGEVVLFTQKNPSGGSDIYAIFQGEARPELLVSCGKEICIDPAISADGRLFAFSRNRDPVEGETTSLTYIYTGIIEKGEAGITPLITEKSIPGILPSFSPDGGKLSFYDIKSQGIRIENKTGSNDFLLGTNRMQRGSWSPDGRKFLFVDDEMGEHAIVSRLYCVDVTNSTINEPLKEKLLNIELGEPEWSPDGTKIVAGTRSEGGPLTRQLVVYDLITGVSTQITDEPSVMNASPKWSPDGQYLVFQQARLGSSNARPVVAVWDDVKKTISLIAEDAALPVWMP